MPVLDVRRLTLQVPSLSPSSVRKLQVLMRKRRSSTLESWPKQLTSERSEICLDQVLDLGACLDLHGSFIGPETD